jgi:peroxiredoxin (alkyl hydroperoxide reductase subunit C)
MADVGQPAPDFTLVDQNQQKVTLSQYRGSKNVVLSFHVYSFTGG